MKLHSKLEKHCQTWIGGCGIGSVEFKRHTCRSNLSSSWNHVGKLIGSIALPSVYHSQPVYSSVRAEQIGQFLSCCPTTSGCRPTVSLPLLLHAKGEEQKQFHCLTSSLFVFFNSDQNMKVGLP